MILEVGPIIDITDYFVICSGSNDPQVSAIVDEVSRRMRTQSGVTGRTEGQRDKRWVLIDFIDVVVHVFNDQDREFYELERLWKDAARVQFDVEDELAAGEG